MCSLVAKWSWQAVISCSFLRKQANAKCMSFRSLPNRRVMETIHFDIFKWILSSLLNSGKVGAGILQRSIDRPTTCVSSMCDVSFDSVSKWHMSWPIRCAAGRGHAVFSMEPSRHKQNVVDHLVALFVLWSYSLKKTRKQLNASRLYTTRRLVVVFFYWR